MQRHTDSWDSWRPQDVGQQDTSTWKKMQRKPKTIKTPQPAEDDCIRQVVQPEVYPTDSVLKTTKQSPISHLAHEIASRIKRESKAQNAEEAAHRISSIWREIDRLAGLAEARLRLCLFKIGKPELAELDWINEQIVATELGNPCERSAIHSGVLLIRAVLADRANTPNLRPTYEDEDHGSLAISWDIGDARIRWVVAPNPLPWPGVKVTSFVTEGPDKKPTYTRYYMAKEVVEEFSSIAENHQCER